MNNSCLAIEDLSGYVSKVDMSIFDWESIMQMGSGLDVEEKDGGVVDVDIDFILAREIANYSSEDLRLLKIWQNGPHRCLSSHHYDNATIDAKEDVLGSDNELWAGEFNNYEINRKTIFKITRLSGKECIYYVKIKTDEPFGVPV